MEEKTLNSAESLALIEQMIAATREKYEKGSGNAFLVYGYTSLFVGTLTTVLVSLTGNLSFLFLWWLIPVLGFPINYFVNADKVKGAKSYLDSFVGNLWLVLGAFLVIFPLVGMFSPLVGFMIIPFESLMLSIGILVTGISIKSTPVILSGIFAALLSFVMYFISTGYEYVFLAMFVLGMIVPGHLLNHKARCSKN